MAKVKFKGTKKMSSRLQQRFTSFTRNEEEMTKAAKIMRNELVRNLRDGVDSKDKLLPSLKDSTINQRGQLSRYNRTATRYNQTLSNLTFTGQFVRSLRVSFVSKGSFIFKYVGVHIGYKNQDGTKRDNVNNSEIFGWLSDKWFRGKRTHLTGVTPWAQNRIKKQFIRFIRRK